VRHQSVKPFLGYDDFWDIFKMATLSHLGFVISMFGQPTKSIWWSLSLHKISLESMHGFDNNMQALIF